MLEISELENALNSILPFDWQFAHIQNSGLEIIFPLNFKIIVSCLPVTGVIASVLVVGEEETTKQVWSIVILDPLCVTLLKA